MKKFFFSGKIGKNPSFKREIAGFISCFAFYTFFERKVIGCALTKGRSMEPNIEDTNVVVIDRLFYKYFRIF